MSENLPPPMATHVDYFYGNSTYYRRTLYQHLNQVSEEREWTVKWSQWDYRRQQWEDVGAGFSDRNLKELKS